MATVHLVNAVNMGGAFDPASLSVSVGTTVRWVNTSGNIHNVTFYDPAVKSSGVLSGNDSFQVLFDHAGTFKYHCTFHPGMDGAVVVS